MKVKRSQSIKLLVFSGSTVLVLLVFCLTALAPMRRAQLLGVGKFIQSVNMTADRKALELDACFKSIENSVHAAEDYILRTIDEERILESPAYEKEYMDSLSGVMTLLASLSDGVVSSYFRMEVERFGGERGIFLEGNGRGRFVSVKPTDILQFSPTDMEHVGWYYTPVWTGKPVWTAPYENKNINIHMISYIVPLYRGNDLLGIVGMDINLAALKEIVDSLPEDRMLGVLLGQGGTLVYYSSSSSMVRSVEASADARAMAAVMSSKTDGELRDFQWRGMPHQGVMRKLGNGMTLVIAGPVAAGAASRKGFLIDLIYAFAVSAVLLVLFLFFLDGTILGPIRLMTLASHRLARGELNRDIPYKSGSELGLLADNIRKMKGQMTEYIDWIREQTLRERQAKEAALAESQNKSEFLASVYVSLHEVDLNADTFKEVHSRKDIAKMAGTSFDHARATIRSVMEQRMKDREGFDRKDFMEFIDFTTLDERMKDRITIAHEFYSILDYWCRARFILVDRNPDGSLHHVLWAVENIDEERREREELRNEAERSLAASQAKSAFLANMSHEIRTPINAVLGMDEMILRECTDRTIQGYASNIKMAGTSLLSIVNDILDFSKIEAGKMELLPDNYDIASLVVDLVNMIQGRAKGKGLAFVLDCDPGLPKTVYGDSVRIKQCALNILTNAVKYTKEGSVTFRVAFEKKDEEHILLQVSVKDTGSGIKQEDMDKLFSPFERIEEGKNKTIEGTGLGMSIVTKLLAMMGSSLQVQSEYGKGSCFSFAVEQAVVDWTPSGDIEEAYRKSVEHIEAYKEKLYAPRARLLFVDDTEMNLEVIRGLLKKTGMQIDTATGGKEALGLVARNTYDILFLDHRMPEMDGIETLHAMQAMQDNLSAGKPCVALTANALSGVRKMYLDEGFDDYLSKPVNPAKLEEMIRHFLPEDYLEAPPDADAQGAGTDGQNAGPTAGPEVGQNAGPEAGLKAEETILSRLRGVEGIDADAALANCGTEEVLASTLRSYESSIDSRAGELEALYEAGDWKGYGIKVHAVKSTSRLIGAAALSGDAAKLEALADSVASDSADSNASNDSIEQIRSMHGPFIAGFRKMKDLLAPVLGKGAADGKDEASKPPVSQEKLAELLGRLSACAGDFDIDGLDAVMAELNGAALPADFEETMARIRTCVDNVDFKGLRELLAEQVQK